MTRCALAWTAAQIAIAGQEKPPRVLNLNGTAAGRIVAELRAREPHSMLMLAVKLRAPRRTIQHSLHLLVEAGMVESRKGRQGGAALDAGCPNEPTLYALR